MDIPPDLLQLRVEFLRADQRCKDIADALPTARDIIHGRAEITEAQAEELRAARADRMRIVMALHKHPWLESLPLEERAPARRALEKAAVEALTVNA